jgi:superfamily II DNA or RNA helicase
MPTKPTPDRNGRNPDSAGLLQQLPRHCVPGSSVTARGARWRVDAGVPHADCCELHLSGLRDGARRVLLWPFDRPAAVDVARFPRVVRVRRWIRALQRSVAQTIDPATPRARAATAEVLPYQLAPAIAVARGASRVLLADEAGLGKTVQAGWIVADRLEREPNARIIVAVPAGLRRQWTEELARLFEIHVIGVDARWLRERVADVPADASPWAAPGVYLGSMDFLKRPDVADALRTHVWDLIVIDEAHTATAPTERHMALGAIAARARCVVGISATPFSGDPAAFSSLAALGCVAGEMPPLMFRRSREDAGDGRSRRHRFASVRISRPEFRFQRLLERYSSDVWREAPTEGDGAKLAVTILRKRALSSPASAARSLARRLELLRGAAAPARQLSLFDDEDPMDDEMPDAALGAPGLADGARERRALSTLIDAANHAVPHDSKHRYVRRFLRRLRGESAIVFTEYRDTLMQLAGTLPPALHLHGGLTPAARAEVQRRFNAEGGLLLATDAAAEGLNLQHRCRVVVNYELPWNPARLEQRIGRVDRIGQRRRVHAITLVARDTAEDLVIANLARRLERIAATLGERDRLAAYLTDARTARIVIGGAASEAEPQEERPAPAVRMAPSPDNETARAAAQVERRAHGDSVNGVLVSSARTRADLTPGIVLVVRASARTHDGRLVAERLLILHAKMDAPRYSKAADLKREATAAIGCLQDGAADRLSQLEDWFDSIRREHENSVQQRLDRELAIAERDGSHAEIQPGLFDRRAIRQAERASALDAQVAAEHRDRLAALERERTLDRSVDVIGVLVVWR